MNELSIDEIRVLLEAMEAWEEKDFATEIMDVVMSSVLGGKADERVSAELTKRQQKFAEDRANRKERSILIRAKLIGLLDTKRAAELVR